MRFLFYVGLVGEMMESSFGQLTSNAGFKNFYDSFSSQYIILYALTIIDYSYSIDK